METESSQGCCISTSTYLCSSAFTVSSFRTSSESEETSVTWGKSSCADVSRSSSSLRV